MDDDETRSEPEQHDQVSSEEENDVGKPPEKQPTSCLQSEEQIYEEKVRQNGEQQSGNNEDGSIKSCTKKTESQKRVDLIRKIIERCS